MQTRHRDGWTPALMLNTAITAPVRCCRRQPVGPVHNPAAGGRGRLARFATVDPDHESRPHTPIPWPDTANACPTVAAATDCPDRRLPHRVAAQATLDLTTDH